MDVNQPKKTERCTNHGGLLTEQPTAATPCSEHAQTPSQIIPDAHPPLPAHKLASQSQSNLPLSHAAGGLFGGTATLAAALLRAKQNEPPVSIKQLNA